MKPYDTEFSYSTGDTTFRLRPNPDAPSGTGFTAGGVMEWRDNGDKEWKGYFFIAPEALGPMSAAMTEAAKDIE